MTAIDDGIVALASAISQNTGPSITNFGGAVQALQSAGNTAAANLGPAIDSLSGGNPKVMTMTHWAWLKNGELSNLPIDNSANAAVLNNAASMLSQMKEWYRQANLLAKSLHYVAPAVSAAHPMYSPPPSYSPAPQFEYPPPMVSPPKSVVLEQVFASGIGASVGFAVAGPIGGILGAGAGYILSKFL
jgi:hypothetical protein